MRHSIPPRGRTPVRPQKLTIPRPKLHLKSIANGLPLKGRIEAAGWRDLKDLAAGYAEEERFVGSREVLAVATLEANDRRVIRSFIDKLDLPSGLSCGAVALLGDSFFVVFGEEVFVVVAAEADGFGAVEEVHGEE